MGVLDVLAGVVLGVYFTIGGVLAIWLVFGPNPFSEEDDLSPARKVAVFGVLLTMWPVAVLSVL